MKKILLSTVYFLTTLFFVTDSFAKELVNYQNYFQDNNLNDSIIKSNQVFVCPFLTDIDQETATKIDAFIQRKLGVISSSTNIVSKEISVTMIENSKREDMDFVFRAVKIKFLGPQDTPPPVVKEH